MDPRYKTKLAQSAQEIEAQIELLKEQPIVVADPSWASSMGCLAYPNSTKSHVFKNTLVWEDRRKTLVALRNKIGALGIDISSARDEIMQMTDEHDEATDAMNVFEPLNKSCYDILTEISSAIIQDQPTIERILELFWFDCKKLLCLLGGCNDWKEVSVWVCYSHPIPPPMKYWLRCSRNTEEMRNRLTILDTWFHNGITLDQANDEIIRVFRPPASTECIVRKRIKLPSESSSD